MNSLRHSCNIYRSRFPADLPRKVSGVKIGSVNVDSNNMLIQQVRWKPSTTNQLLTGYTLRYWGKMGPNGTTTVANQTFAELVFEKPTEMITYYVKVSAKSGAGVGPPSKTLTIKYNSKYMYKQ